MTTLHGREEGWSSVKPREQYVINQSFAHLSAAQWRAPQMTEACPRASPCRPRD
jgi:hypothetical protein